jgi:hypothetical protein
MHPRAPIEEIVSGLADTTIRVPARRERGQATVEFALILPVFLLLVAGIVKFGIALNYWLDMQRVANQGARWATVNAYPGCPRTGPNSPCSPTLQNYLAAQKIAQGEILKTCITFPNATSAIGDPVKVAISRPMNLGIPFVPISVTINGSATMRLEQAAGRFAAGCST